MAAPAQLPLGVRLRDTSVFATYHAGNNAETVATLRTLAPAVQALPVWLWGAAGTGKTHLLQALCAAAGAAGKTAAYVPLAQVRTLGPEVLTGCGRLTFVCLDDLTAVAGDPAWERAVFALLAELADGSGRLVATAQAGPAGAGIVLKDLASRFAGGTVLKLQPLDEAARCDALRLRAAQRGLELPEDTAHFLLNRLPRDMHSLCAFLDTLDEAALVAQRRLTVPFVSSILKGGAQAGSP